MCNLCPKIMITCTLSPSIKAGWDKLTNFWKGNKVIKLTFLNKEANCQLKDIDSESSVLMYHKTTGIMKYPHMFDQWVPKLFTLQYHQVKTWKHQNIGYKAFVVIFFTVIALRQQGQSPQIRTHGCKQEAWNLCSHGKHISWSPGT